MLSVVSFANQTKEDVKTSVDIENVVVEETSAYCTTTLYGYWVVSKKKYVLTGVVETTYTFFVTGGCTICMGASGVSSECWGSAAPDNDE